MLSQLPSDMSQILGSLKLVITWSMTFGEVKVLMASETLSGQFNRES